MKTQQLGINLNLKIMAKSKSEYWSREYAILALYNHLYGCSDIGFGSEEELADFMNSPVTSLKMDKDFVKRGTIYSFHNIVPQPASPLPAFLPRLQNQLKNLLNSHQWSIGEVVTLRHKSWKKNDNRHCTVFDVTGNLPSVRVIGDPKKEFVFNRPVPTDFEIVYPNSYPAIYSKVNLLKK